MHSLFADIFVVVVGTVLFILMIYSFYMVLTSKDEPENTGQTVEEEQKTTVKTHDKKKKNGRKKAA